MKTKWQRHVLTPELPPRICSNKGRDHIPPPPLHLKAASWCRRADAANTAFVCWCWWTRLRGLLCWWAGNKNVWYQIKLTVITPRFTTRALCYPLHADLRGTRSGTSKKQDAISSSCTKYCSCEYSCEQPSARRCSAKLRPSERYAYERYYVWPPGSERICKSEKTDALWLINTEPLVAQLAPSMQRERKEEKMRWKSEQSWASAVAAAHTYAVPGNGTADCCRDSAAECVCVCCAGASAGPRCGRWDIAFQVMRLFVGFQSLATPALNVLAATASFTASQFWVGLELDFAIWNERLFFF